VFRPGSPEYEELLQLASLATRDKLLDGQRARWRELTRQLLGSIREQQTFTPERQHLRAPVELEVDILAPDEMASLATSTIGSGGLSIRIAEIIPIGTQVDLSIKLPGRKVPLLAKGQVVWSYPAAAGVAFVDLYQNDREHLEALAVQALLRGDG
jgi:hypothetical protein